MLFVESVAAAAFVAGALVALADLRVMRRVRPGHKVDREASVTAIVPARDEGSNIGAWVRAVRRQTHPPAQIIVVDDCSSDATAAEARAAGEGDPRVVVRSFGEPPPGWVGKNWAAGNASRSADGQWLLFSDADVRMEPEALTAALAVAAELGVDAVSLSATLVLQTWLERQVMPVVASLIFSGIPACLVNDDRVPTGLLAGGFLLVRRDAYERVGGHRAVRGSIAEDRDLGERLKAFGYRIRMVDGSALVRVRMYQGAAQMWEGWRKNFYEGARRRPLVALGFIAACLCMLVLPVPLLAALGIARMRRPLRAVERRLAAACAVCVAATALVRSVRDRTIGVRTDVMSVLATPIGGAFAAAVMAASAWRVESSRGQVWKGRVIP